MSDGEKGSPDYSKDSAEDEQTDAPTGKEAVTDEDEKLDEDQTAFQTDSS
jgi:hypothetical protein